MALKPLMDTLEAANADKAAAEEQLAKANAAVAKVEKKLEGLQKTLLAATTEKMKVEAIPYVLGLRFPHLERETKIVLALIDTVFDLAYLAIAVYYSNALRGTLPFRHLSPDGPGS